MMDQWMEIQKKLATNFILVKAHVLIQAVIHILLRLEDTGVVDIGKFGKTSHLKSFGVLTRYFQKQQESDVI